MRTKTDNPPARPRTVSRKVLSALQLLVAMMIAGSFFALASGCARNPATGERDVILISESQEIALGRQAQQSVLAQFGPYEDQALDDYVSALGQRLAAVSERSDLPWEFHVLDSPVPNAFALPGGFIYITRGMLALLNSEAQLAGVLGHEIGHVTARHSAQQISRSQLAQLGLGLGSIFIEDFDTAGQVAGVGIGLLFLEYSRDDEHEADLLGIRYSTRAGYDPREIPDTYLTLARLQEQSGQSTPSFLSTHPDPGTRAERTRQLAAEAVADATTQLLVEEAGYRNRCEDLVYGEDPRQGFLEGDTFYHPNLRFQWTLPLGWSVQNLPRVVTVQNKDIGAAFQLTLVPSGGSASPSSYVEHLRSEGAIAASAGSSRKIGGWPAWVGEITVLDSNGDPRIMHAAWVQREPDYLYQFLGVPGEPSVGSIFLESVGSFSELTDPNLLAREPDRIHIATVSRTDASLEAIAAEFSHLAVSINEVAFINGLYAESVVPRGELIKVVLEPAG